MIKSKVLSDAAWKDLLGKSKGVKDNGLLKTLSDCKKVGDDDHEGAQKVLDEVLKLSAQLKKSKEVAALPLVGKFLSELTAAADTALRDVAKSRAEAQKNAKAVSEAAKKREHDGAKDEGDEEEEESSALLTTKLLPLLRQVAKGERMHALVASTGKQVAVMLSRKPIPPARRKLLADHLGVSGGIKYLVGHCFKEDGATTFALKTEVSGMAKKIKAALLQQTNLRVKLRCRGEDGQTDDDEDGDEAGAHDGADGGDEQSADDKRGDDSKRAQADQVPKFVPGVEIKTPAPTLAQAPQLWKGTRELLKTSIDALRDAVKSQLADEGGAFADEVGDNLQKLDRILGKLDKRLINSLTSAAETEDPASRAASMKESKAILADYIRYVRSEPLIEHLDSNPFGVKTNLKVTLSNSLSQVAKAIG